MTSKTSCPFVSTARLLAGAALLGLAAVPGFSAEAKRAPAPAHTRALSAAQVSLPPANTGTPFGKTATDLAARGYVEQEFFVSGTANRYRLDAKFSKNAEIVDSGHAYKTRILVRRPTNPKKFNGTVIVEWFNVTGMQDIEFLYAAVREHLLDQGYAWVGVSAQLVGIDALKKVNPARYGKLSLSVDNTDPVGGGKLDERGDVLGWDAWTQIGNMLRRPGKVDPLGGLKPKMIIASGESQSAMRLSQYYNTVYPMTKSTWDGFLLYDRLLTGFRTDVGTKMITVGSEVVRNGFGPAPADNEHLRVWEPAGAAHISYDEVVPYLEEQVFRNGLMVGADGKPHNFSLNFAGCQTYPLWSRVPNGHVLDTAVEALVGWVTTGKAPPITERLRADDAGKLYRDADGRVSGGIRLAAYDAPRAKNIGENGGSFPCPLPGYHIDYTPAEMCDRYGSHAGYVEKVVAVTRKAQKDGFLLQSDAQKTIAEARNTAFTCS